MAKILGSLGVSALSFFGACNLTSANEIKTKKYLAIIAALTPKVYALTISCIYSETAFVWQNHQSMHRGVASAAWLFL